MESNNWMGMLDLGLIIKEYGKPKGILHLGAHLAEEFETYKSFGIKNVVWVEANKDLYEKLSIKLQDSGQKFFCELLSDKDGVDIDFNITYNRLDGSAQSSSVLEFGLHKDFHPHVVYDKSVKMVSKTLNTLLSENNISTDDYDFMNLDLQGYELTVLKGFDLSGIKYIYTEVNVDEVYKNCTKIDDLDAYLSPLGFERKLTSVNNCRWGEAFYVKK